MNGIIFELEEKSKYTGRYMDGEISYNNTSIDYTKEIRECDRKSEIKDLLNDPCLGKIFEKGEVDDEIIYNGNIEDVKEEWMRAIDKDWSSRSQKTVAGCVGNAPGRRVSARSGGGHHRSPVESKSVRKRFANRWMS